MSGLGAGLIILAIVALFVLSIILLLMPIFIYCRLGEIKDLLNELVTIKNMENHIQWGAITMVYNIIRWLIRVIRAFL